MSITHYLSIEHETCSVACDKNCHCILLRSVCLWRTVTGYYSGLCVEGWLCLDTAQSFVFRNGCEWMLLLCCWKGTGIGYCKCLRGERELWLNTAQILPCMRSGTQNGTVSLKLTGKKTPDHKPHRNKVFVHFWNLQLTEELQPSLQDRKLHITFCHITWWFLPYQGWNTSVASHSSPCTWLKIFCNSIRRHNLKITDVMNELSGKLWFCQTCYMKHWYIIHRVWAWQVTLTNTLSFPLLMWYVYEWFTST